MSATAGSAKHWELQYRVNVHGPFHCIRAALPTMLEQGSGSIINISSVYGIVGSPGGAAYHASKGAVRTFTKGTDGRPRFAHSAPVHIEVPGKPQRARRVEVEHLAAQVRAEIERNKDILPPKALAEFQKALTFYEGRLETAR